MNGRISVAGRSDDRLLKRIQTIDARTDAADPVSAADALADAADEEEYQAILMRLIREQGAVDLSEVDIPRKPGPVGACLRFVRAVLWKWLRYQHETVTSRHNAVHALHAAALECEREARQRRMDDLEQRLARLERASDNRDSAPPSP